MPGETPGARATRRGLGLAVTAPADTIRCAAAAAREHGYASFWLNNPTDSPTIRILSEVAEVAAPIQLGVGVVPLSGHRPEDVAREVAQSGIPRDRLYLGIGSGPGAGSVSRVREGIARLRSALDCFLVVAALGPKMCRLAGAEADGVLFNWLTPTWAQQALAWVREGAESAGRPVPKAMAYLRVALGPEAATRVRQEAARYEAMPHYAAHFRRMGTPAAATAVMGNSATEIQRALATWDGILDEVVVRVITASDSSQDAAAVIAAARPRA